MKVAIFGSGYVGLVAGVCFAEVGHRIIGVDVVPEKVERLNQGIPTIYEIGLEELLQSNRKAGRISFTTNAQEAIEESELIFIAVGTPEGADGQADLKFVRSVAETIGAYINGYKVIVDKSTVPVGTAQKVTGWIKQAQEKRGTQFDYEVISNPEFLREGVAVQDFLDPDRVVVGTTSEKALGKVKELYRPILERPGNQAKNQLFEMDVVSAEMTKYAANALLATKISFMNEIANLCDKVNANVDHVRIGIGSDHRIGPYFLNAGVGYGGSCFPKDVKALLTTSRREGATMELLVAVEEANRRQKTVMLDKIDQKLGDELKGKCFAIWGLAFKPGTDDMREAPALVIIEGLLQRGAKIQVHDPKAMEETRKHTSLGEAVTYVDDQYQCLNGADALVVVTEWEQFCKADLKEIKSRLVRPLVFDGRNIFQPKVMREMGFDYTSIGRP